MTELKTQMHSTYGKVVRRRIRKLFTSPLVVWPTLQGGLLAYWCNDGVWNNWDGFAWGMLALGLGIAAYRWTLGNRKHSAIAREDLRRIGRKKETAKLKALRRRTIRVRDPRIEQSLNQLTKAYDRLLQVDRWRCERASKNGLELAEVHDQASRLYIECRNLLEKSHELYNGASQMATDSVRKRVMTSREDLLKELQTSLQHLDHALDEVYSSQLSGKERPIAEASELRDELQRQVAVARQVEERMEDLASEWRVVDSAE